MPFNFVEWAGIESEVQRMAGREQFEEAMRRVYGKGMPDAEEMQWAWQGWQAARAAPAQANAMRCDFCNVNFADRQPGSLCPKCYRELSSVRAAPAQTVDCAHCGKTFAGPGFCCERDDCPHAANRVLNRAAPAQPDGEKK